MQIRIAMLCLLAIFFIGCSSTDVSKREPFMAFVGQTVELRRPMVVVQQKNRWFNGGSVVARRSIDFGLKDINKTDKTDHISAQLPVGHRVRIESIRDEVIVDGEWIVAYGWTTIPPNPKEVRFAYDWGFIWILNRAPWESETVPERRDLSSTNTVKD